MSVGRAVAAASLCAALAVLHTWPLATDPAGLSRLDNADTALNTWIVAWVAYELPRAPLQVFDAPIFHPERRTLAYSEPLLLPGAMAIPLRAAGASPTLTYNLLAGLGLALGAWAMWLLVAGWTADWAAGAVAGLAFAFNAHTLTRFGQLQSLHLEGVPVIFLGLDRLVTRGRRRDGLLLGVGLVLVGLTSLYLLAFMAAAIVVGVFARAPEWRARPTRTLGAAALGVAIAIVVLTPMLLEYWQVHRELGLQRTLEETARYGATWRDYLSTAGRIHYALWSSRFVTATALFPGLVVMGLAAWALVDRQVHRGRVRMLAAMAVVGVVLSFGPAFPVYEWLYDAVPLLGATRVASRWGGLALMAAAALAGLGLAALRARVGPGAARVLAVIVPVLVTAEALRAPMGFMPTPAVPAIYRHVATLPAAVLLEYPLFPGGNFSLNAPYLLAQLEHRKPIVAGYSGFSTPAFAQRVAALAGFPDERARQEIRTLGVTHVVLHLGPLRQQFGQPAIDALDRVPWLERIAGDETARLYAVRP